VLFSLHRKVFYGEFFFFLMVEGFVHLVLFYLRRNVFYGEFFFLSHDGKGWTLNDV